MYLADLEIQLSDGLVEILSVTVSWDALLLIIFERTADHTQRTAFREGLWHRQSWRSCLFCSSDGLRLDCCCGGLLIL